MLHLIHLSPRQLCRFTGQPNLTPGSCSATGIISSGGKIDYFDSTGAITGGIYGTTLSHSARVCVKADGFNGNTDRSTKVTVAFTDPPTARYVRIRPRTWTNHISMRAGLLIGQATEAVPYERLSYSSTHGNVVKGIGGCGQGMLDSPDAWCANSNDLNQWIQMDAGLVKVINGVVTQGRQIHDQWVTSYFIEISSDGNTWFLVGGTLTSAVDGSYLSYSDGLNSPNTLPAPDEWTVVCATSRADSPVLVNGIERSRSCQPPLNHLSCFGCGDLMSQVKTVHLHSHLCSCRTKVGISGTGTGNSPVVVGGSGPWSVAEVMHDKIF